MAISHRLHNDMFKRPDDDKNEVPKRVVFLSLEGNTETDYFTYVDKYREQLGIDALVRIEALHKKDTNSDPDSVYELLLEYISIRENAILPEEIYDILCDNSIIDIDDEKFSIENVRKYLNNELPDKDSKKFKSAIRLAGIDIDYQKFLCDCKGENDVFAIVIDRDKGSHSEKNLRNLIQKCKNNQQKCYCFLTNPCIEFWLLLHLSDVKEEYKVQIDELLKNEHVSNEHTFVSRELSNKAHHKKKIKEGQFVQHYLNNIDIAIERAADFEQDEEALLNGLGSNIPKLFEILREDLQ